MSSYSTVVTFCFPLCEKVVLRKLSSLSYICRSAKQPSLVSFFHGIRVQFGHLVFKSNICPVVFIKPCPDTSLFVFKPGIFSPFSKKIKVRKDLSRNWKLFSFYVFEYGVLSIVSSKWLDTFCCLHEQVQGIFYATESTSVLKVFFFIECESFITDLEWVRWMERLFCTLAECWKRFTTI